MLALSHPGRVGTQSVHSRLHAYLPALAAGRLRVPPRTGPARGRQPTAHALARAGLYTPRPRLPAHRRRRRAAQTCSGGRPRGGTCARCSQPRCMMWQWRRRWRRPPSSGGAPLAGGSPLQWGALGGKPPAGGSLWRGGSLFWPAGASSGGREACLLARRARMPGAPLAGPPTLPPRNSVAAGAGRAAASTAAGTAAALAASAGCCCPESHGWEAAAAEPVVRQQALLMPFPSPPPHTHTHTHTHHPTPTPPPAPQRGAGQHHPAEAGGPAAGQVVQAAGRVQQDGAADAGAGEDRAPGPCAAPLRRPAPPHPLARPCPSQLGGHGRCLLQNNPALLLPPTPHPPQLERGVICSSAGNHAQGVALAARQLVG